MNPSRTAAVALAAVDDPGFRRSAAHVEGHRVGEFERVAKRLRADHAAAGPDSSMRTHSVLAWCDS